jgi:hypothetical protein
MAEASARSLEIVAEEVKSERRMQLAHFDSLDSRAGIVLGFAGAIVALTPSGRLLLAAPLLEYRSAVPEGSVSRG